MTVLTTLYRGRCSINYSDDRRRVYTYAEKSKQGDIAMPSPRESLIAQFVIDALRNGGLVQSLLLDKARIMRMRQEMLSTRLMDNTAKKLLLGYIALRSLEQDPPRLCQCCQTEVRLNNFGVAVMLGAPGAFEVEDDTGRIVVTFVCEPCACKVNDWVKETSRIIERTLGEVEGEPRYMHEPGHA